MDVLPDRILCDLARASLREQSKVLSGHLEGALSRDDIEDVHQVRVACRRMRAGLAFFGDCFDDDKAARWRTQLKKMLRRFGPARDCDVHIEFLEGILADHERVDKKDRPGIARLLLRLKQQRDELQRGIVKAVRRLELDKFLINLHLETERLQYEVEHADESAGRISFYKRAAEQVDQRLTEVQKRISALEDQADQVGHHTLRIAVKKLRYTLELCDVALKGKLKQGLKRLKQFQTLLGGLHDCDAWAAQIETFIAEETARTEAYYGHLRPMRRLLAGLQFLQTQRQQERDRLFCQTTKYAAELEENDFWVWIVDAVKDKTNVPNADGAECSCNDEDSNDGQ